MQPSHRLFRFAVFLCLCLGAGQSHAMWAKADDEQLVRSSALIVEATYTGQVTFSPDAGASGLTLGVLRVTRLLQGDPATELVFLRVPTLGFIRKSDDIGFTSGQQGLWFLRADEAYPGLYLADHPQRFVPETQATDKIRSIQELLP